MIDGMKAENTTLARSARRVLIGIAYAVMFSVAGIAHAESGAGAAPESPQAEAVYDGTQPGADDPRAKAGFEAYKAGDFERAYDIWLPLAEAGNAEAQFRIGRLYDFGHGVAKNGELVLKWYEAAAKQGHVSANNNLGYLYDVGEFVGENREIAEKYYMFAAERGDSSALQNLGIMYALLPEEHRDFAEAYKWLFLAEYYGNSKSFGTIRKLDSFATPDEKVVGRMRMREWLENHSRPFDQR